MNNNNNNETNDNDMDNKTNNTIDIDLIETQKENIQPIKSGRSAKQLISLFKPSTTKNNFNPINLTQERKQTHEKFKYQIKLLHDSLLFENPNKKVIHDFDEKDQVILNQLLDDPLDIHLQYIRWTIEAYPAGGTTAESNLIPLLEQVTRKFMRFERYRQDIRYLKCWLFYADQVNDSNNNNKSSTKLILNFLIHNRIGTSLPLLYMEYFKLFLPMFNIVKINQDDDWFYKLEQVIIFGVSQTSLDPDHHQVVQILNQIQSLKLKISHQIKQKDELGKGKKVITRNIKTNKNKMKIFEDSNDNQDQTTESSSTSCSEIIKTSNEKNLDSSSSSFEQAFSLITKWDNLGTVASNRKQNTLNPSAWKGQKLPMKISSSNNNSNPSIINNNTSIRSSKMKIFEDRFLDEEKKEEQVNESTEEPRVPSETETNQDDDGSRKNNTEQEDRVQVSGEKNSCLNGFDLLDDILRSEIESHILSMNHHHQQQQDDHDDYQVLKFDPLKFHSL